MKAENTALLAIVLVIVVVATAGAAFFVLSPRSIPQSLPVPVGTVFTYNDTAEWVVHFTAGPFGGRLAGAWTAYEGFGFIALFVVNGTVSKPSPWLFSCPLLHRWSQSNGSIDELVSPGDHTAYWSTGYCSAASQIVVTETIDLVSP